MLNLFIGIVIGFCVATYGLGNIITSIDHFINKAKTVKIDTD
jgi:hypothetical protein